MKTKLLAGVAAIGMMSGVAAGAQSLSYGVGLTSDYISRGISQTNNGAALQAWAEYESSGFYAGIWGSNVDFSPGDTDTIEVDLYGGYRWSVSNTSFDVGYARYLYNGTTGDAGGELYFLVNHDLSDSGASLFAGVHADPSAGALTNAHGGISMPLMDRLSGSARLGITPGFVPYGDMGATYSFNDNASVDLRLHGRTGLGLRLVLSTAFSF